MKCYCYFSSIILLSYLLGFFGLQSAASAEQITTEARVDSLVKKGARHFQTYDFVGLRGVVTELVAMGTSAVPALLDKSEDQDSAIRSVAISALGEMRSTDPRVDAALQKSLSDDIAICRLSGLTALSQTDPLWSTRSVSRLISLLNDKDDKVVYRAAQHLTFCDSDGMGAVPKLIVIVKDVERARGVRFECLNAVLRISPNDDQLKKAIYVMLKDDDLRITTIDTIRFASSFRVGIDDERLISMVITYARKCEKNEREVYARFFSAIGAKGALFVPLLIEWLREEPFSAGIEAAGSIGVYNAELADILCKSVERNENNVSEEAAMAISRFGVKAKSTGPRLLTTLSVVDVRIKAAIAVALGTTGK